MKLWYDKRLSDPTYYGQVGIRNGKKVTSKNVKNFGKHSELLKITNDPVAYVREEIEKWNEEYRVGKVSYEISADFNERVPRTENEASSATWRNTAMTTRCTAYGAAGTFCAASTGTNSRIRRR